MTVEIFLLLIGAISMLVYCIIGVGVARMVADVKKREIRIIDILFWWIVCVVFAICGDCQ